MGHAEVPAFTAEDMNCARDSTLWYTPSRQNLACLQLHSFPLPFCWHSKKLWDFIGRFWVVPEELSLTSALLKESALEGKQMPWWAYLKSKSKLREIWRKRQLFKIARRNADGNQQESKTIRKVEKVLDLLSHPVLRLLGTQLSL